MDIDKYIEIADDVADRLIKLSTQNKTNNKPIMDLYIELLGDKYYSYRYNILTYIPERLSIKGYEIVTSNPLVLKKY